jgi:hypothetical protein
MVGAKTLKLILTFMPRASGNASGDVADSSIYDSGAIGDATDTSGIATDTNGKMPIVGLEY